MSFILRPMKVLTSTILSGLLGLCAVACGSKAPAPVEPKPADASATMVLPDVPFDKLDHEQKIAFMKQKVMPAMKPVFQNHDPKAFAEFRCTVCHGDGAKEGHFDMPNPKLPKLNFKDMSKFKKEDVEWMGKEVMPTMGKVLNLTLYSPDNPTGFGCLACHTQEGQ
jgi:mono/diheme cytochrome c family protein